MDKTISQLEPGDYGLSKEEIDALRTPMPGFWPLGAAQLGLREIERIQAERAASEQWNAKPDAAARRYNLECAAQALRVCAAITYFETA